MSTSNTTLRLLTVLFILAGILLLRKPVFGQTITAVPIRFSVVIQGVAPSKSADVILVPGLSTLVTSTPPKQKSSLRTTRSTLSGLSSSPRRPPPSIKPFTPLSSPPCQLIESATIPLHRIIIGTTMLATFDKIVPARA